MNARCTAGPDNLDKGLKVWSVKRPRGPQHTNYSSSEMCRDKQAITKGTHTGHAVRCRRLSLGLPC
jgi:hypothetical protein